jgi:hypothetical protein
LDSVGIFISLANRLILRVTCPTANQIELWDRVMVPISAAMGEKFPKHIYHSIICIVNESLYVIIKT